MAHLEDAVAHTVVATVCRAAIAAHTSAVTTHILDTIAHAAVVAARVAAITFGTEAATDHMRPFEPTATAL